MTTARSPYGSIYVDSDLLLAALADDKSLIRLADETLNFYATRYAPGVAVVLRFKDTDELRRAAYRMIEVADRADER